MTENPYTPSQPHVSDFNVPVVAEFRANGGRVGGMFEGGDLLLLTTVGARSGREHTTPLGYVRAEGRVLVLGSAGGSHQHPDWYHNVLAHPLVRVELGTEEFEAVAVPTEGAERDRLFAEFVRADSGYADYQAQTTRVLPVVALDRVHETGPAEVTNLADQLLRVHAWLRQQLRHVRAEAEEHLAARATATDGPPPLGLSLQLRQHCLAFCESLHFHHTSEDKGMFPALERQAPHLREALRRLSEEHRTVDRIRGDLEKLIADLPTADPALFRARLEEMTRELEAHLDYEESQVIPALSAIPFPPTG